jgi:hypothetical protein
MVLAAVALAAVAVACGGSADGRTSSGQRHPSAFVRVNQVGYGPGDAKVARLLSAKTARNALWSVVDSQGNAVASGRVGRDRGRWSRSFPHVYAIDFSAVRRPGTYSLKVSGTTSPQFRIDQPAALYGSLAANEIRFLREQRDGSAVDPAILQRQPSHLADAHAGVFKTPAYRRNVLVGRLHGAGGTADVAGGWMDAGDTLKYAETSSFSETLLLYALRRYPQAFGGDLGAARDEARFGLEWLLELWRASPRRLIYQVGLGDGNDKTILGAHDTTWRLPQADDALKATRGSSSRYVKYRPAFRDGRPSAGTSPNLAGRMAAAFALGAQVLGPGDPALATRSLGAARTILASARTRHVRRLVTATPASFYPEREWRDDMELGAAELALAEHGRGPYLRQAAHWANAYAGSPLNGTDSLNLYDVAGLAHSELYQAMRAAGKTDVSGVSRGTLVQDLGGQLGPARRDAARDPFSYGDAYRDDDTVAHALGFAIEGRLLDELQGSRRYERFAETQRDLVLGDNAWGTSFVVGAGSEFPHCLHQPVANLMGSLNGSPPVLLGAVVPGPVNARDLKGLTLSRGFRRCPVGGGDAFRRFGGFGARYQDNVLASPTSEPSIDIAALGLLAFAQDAAS